MSKKQEKKKESRDARIVRLAKTYRTGLHTIFDGETLWAYSKKEGIYKSNAEHLINKMLGVRTNISERNEILKRIKSVSYEEEPNFDSNRYLALENGIIDFESMIVEEFSRKYKLTRKLPVNYDSEAKCSSIDLFVQAHLEDPQTFYESVGYFLKPGLPIKSVFWWVGDSNTGKTTLFLVLSSLFGKLKRTVSLHQLTSNRSEYYMQRLKNALVNFHDDTSSKQLNKDETSIIKNYFGGDGELDVRAPYGQIETIRSKAKGVFIPNILPLPYDALNDHAWYNRAVLQVFQNEMKTNESTQFIAKMTTDQELSGLLNKALKGLRSLRKRGHFKCQADLEENKADYLTLTYEDLEKELVPS